MRTVKGAGDDSEKDFPGWAAWGHVRPATSLEVRLIDHEALDEGRRQHRCQPDGVSVLRHQIADQLLAGELVLATVASEPQMPYAQLFRTLRVPSMSHLMPSNMLSALSMGSASTLQDSEYDLSPLSGLKRLISAVTSIA